MDSFKPLIAKVATGATLSRDEAAHAFAQMLSGGSTPSQMGAFLMALRVRGETVDEIQGAVTAMREKMIRVEAPANAMDIVGTGGDASGSWNVSTLAGMIVAACGVPVAKHGNRAASSKSGAADVLQALGVKVGGPPEQITESIRQCGFGFMMAPAHHPSMRHVGPVRVELGTRTIFNILGPVANPASVKRILIGVFSPAWLEPIAETLRGLGAERAWVIHGSDGLDEITTTGISEVASLEGGKITRFEVKPEDAGLPRANPADLKGGEPEHNAEALRAVLAGKPSAYRDIAVLNAAGALIVAGKVANLKDGAQLAQQAIDDGKVRAVLEGAIAATNS